MRIRSVLLEPIFESDEAVEVADKCETCRNSVVESGNQINIHISERIDMKAFLGHVENLRGSKPVLSRVLCWSRLENSESPEGKLCTSAGVIVDISDSVNNSILRTRYLRTFDGKFVPQDKLDQLKFRFIEILTHENECNISELNRSTGLIYHCQKYRESYKRNLL